MRILVVTTNNEYYFKDIEKPIPDLNEIVGGYIEVVHPRRLKSPLVMIVDEEGLLKEYDCNFFGSMLYGTMIHGQPIVGDIVIMAECYGPEGRDLIGLTEKQEKYLLEDLSSYLILKSKEQNK